MIIATTMKEGLIILSKATELPIKWDELAIDYFQTREFLNHTEKYNPCKQRYYSLYHDGEFAAGAVVYTIRLDLLTYLAIPSPFQMNIAGIPCSVSACGLIGNNEIFPQLLGKMKEHEKGLLIVLNLDSNSVVDHMTTGRTLPTVLWRNTFGSWENYLHSLKASYRRRIIHLSRPFLAITTCRSTCERFDSGMYQQYHEVLNRSKGKLETLSQEFFQNLPSNFSLTTFYHFDKLIGWYITTIFGEKFYFFLGGIDYKQNRQYNTYFNILMSVVKDGIENKVSTIDLGQTAEIPKLRLGGILVEKSMLGYHSNRAMRMILKAGQSLLEYSTVVGESHVFKNK